jgi:hypothetical protein
LQASFRQVNVGGRIVSASVEIVAEGLEPAIKGGVLTNLKLVAMNEEQFIIIEHQWLMFCNNIRKCTLDIMCIKPQSI